MRKIWIAAAVVVLIVVGIHVATRNPETPNQPGETSQPERPADKRCPALYYLQNITTNAFKTRNWSIVILEPTETSPEALQAAKNSSQLVLAYINAGYAEDWRDYWDSLWEAGIIHEPAEYEGEYLVEIWSPLWAQTIIDTALQYLDEGYQGIYLDNIDTIETLQNTTWANNRNLTKDITQLVCTIRENITKHNPQAKLYVNIGGAVYLLQHNDFTKCIDGALREELWTAWNGTSAIPQNPEETRSTLQILEQAARNGLTIIIVDPAENKQQANQLCQKAWQHGLIPSPQPAWKPDYDYPPPPDWCPC